jgi:dihydrolipoamide dehydrogenase
MIGEIALAIEMGADAVDIGKTIHPHPTLGESIGMAAEVAHGSCTDLPPGKKQTLRAANKKASTREGWRL